VRDPRDAARDRATDPAGGVRYRTGGARSAADAAVRAVAGADHALSAHRPVAGTEARHQPGAAQALRLAGRGRSGRRLSPMDEARTLLSVTGVDKRFGGLQALSNVGLEIRRGEIYGLIGPNGAGKTTFFNVVTGLYTPDAGRFVLDGTPYEPSAVHRVAAAGIARTFQNIR